MIPDKQVKKQAMKRNKTTWKPGQSGNPAGRPRKGLALVDMLVESLDRPVKGGLTKKQIIVDHLVDKAAGKKSLRALETIFRILQRYHEFQTKTDIEGRLDAVERALYEKTNCTD